MRVACHGEDSEFFRRQAPRVQSTWPGWEQLVVFFLPDQLIQSEYVPGWILISTWMRRHVGIDVSLLLSNLHGTLLTA